MSYYIVEIRPRRETDLWLDYESVRSQQLAILIAERLTCYNPVYSRVRGENGNVIATFGSKKLEQEGDWIKNGF